jgi:hypothetical protein|tara:strand:- start:25 stop:210 length:186 start_codon:yes stop_codon:yes gene_type:complete
MVSQVLSHVPPENPNPGPNDINNEINPRRIMSKNIVILPAIIENPIIRAIDPSDLSRINFS